MAKHPGPRKRRLIKRRNQVACLRKRSRGNCYPTLDMADGAASSLRARQKDPRIRAYRCPVCEMWHVGKQNRWPRKEGGKWVAG